MARSSPGARLSEVARAARVVFTEKGYKRALISDVTDELGLSHGAIYGYVESKAALFHLAVLSAIGVDWDEADLSVPVPTVPLSEVFVRLAQWSPETIFPELDAGLRRRKTTSARDEFTAIIDEFYGALEGNRMLLALIERCAADIPEIGRALLPYVAEGPGVRPGQIPGPAHQNREPAPRAQCGHGRPLHRRGRRLVRHAPEARSGFVHDQ